MGFSNGRTAKCSAYDSRQQPQTVPLLENAPIFPPIFKDADIAAVKHTVYSCLPIIPVTLFPRIKINGIYSVL